MKKPLSLLAAIITLFFLVVLFCLTTAPGFTIVQKVANTFAGNVVSIGSVTGRLSSAFGIKNLHLALPAADVTIDTIEFHWKPGKLFGGHIEVIRGGVDGVDVVLKESSGDLPPLIFPFSVKIDDFSLTELDIRNQTSEVLFHLNHFKTSSPFLKVTFCKHALF